MLDRKTFIFLTITGYSLLIIGDVHGQDRSSDTSPKESIDSNLPISARMNSNLSADGKEVLKIMSNAPVREQYPTEADYNKAKEAWVSANPNIYSRVTGVKNESSSQDEKPEKQDDNE